MVKPKRRSKPRSKPRARFVEPVAKPRVRPIWSPLLLAERLKCSRQHVTNACAAGEIKAERLGSLWLIPLSEVERLSGPVTAE
jgi:excisionase family DNA binding protein